MMRAARLLKAGEPLAIEEVPIPSPKPDEVIVGVRACGLCGTDLHLAVEGTLPVERTPITLGHEAAGVISALGRDVTGWKEGERVSFFPSASCGVCRFCRVGRESLCDDSKVYGMARDGALADFVAVPARTLMRLPDAVPFDIGAIVTDGVATPFHALRSRGRLRAGETVGIFGCGGLGAHAILLARMMGAAQIVAVDIDEHALGRAKRLGADIVIDGRTDVSKAVRQHFGRSGLDLAVEFVGLPATVEQAVRCLGKGGRAVVSGVGMGRPALPPLASFVGREQAILGSFGMDRSDIEELYVLLVTGRLNLKDSVSARYPLGEANQAIAHLARKDGGVIRIVVEPEAKQAKS